ncbi:hypothetical protein GGS21DRAFT_527236 [Xylaria nigripes]|nr:hypothetical protein GGS21DRAFT_527236 [Xylaria nigripes]
MELCGQKLDRSLTRRESADDDNESVKTELCEDLFFNTPPLAHAHDDEHGNNASSATATDRADLIEWLKGGKSPTWNLQHFESLWNRQKQPFASPSWSLTHAGTGIPSFALILPPPNIMPDEVRSTSDDEKRHRDVLKIEPPRSALHSGDFTHEASPDASRSQNEPSIRATQESNDGSRSWIATSPPRDFTPLQFEKRQPLRVRSNEVQSILSPLSTSVSTNYLYKPPTSPLFQSESNDEIDLASHIDRIDLSATPGRKRKHMIMPSVPGSLGASQGLLLEQSSSLRQERNLPYQAHQPRQFLTASSTFSVSGHSSQIPETLHTRRHSITSGVSPLQHASMVGSYEESILHGRMSTTPSRPLNFLAQIGVLGLGKCKSSLRCPPHVTLPFPAVFYSYAGSSHGRSKQDDGPSPYVGQIDLENELPNQEDDAKLNKKQQRRALGTSMERIMGETDAMDNDHADPNTSSGEARKVQRTKRRSGSPRAPLGGYRIPEKGQIQIIIKNPNKTAVKLFLVPYDLTGMEPGTKTFVRQRSYSNGPTIDNIPSPSGNSSADRPILRYLVHLHICCPSRGRFFLYKNIRVVFANRVPDGKEKLRNEITLPEPRYSPYKVTRVTRQQPSSSGSGPATSRLDNPF